jgi:hypothetical protein
VHSHEVSIRCAGEVSGWPWVTCLTMVRMKMKPPVTGAMNQSPGTPPTHTPPGQRPAMGIVDAQVRLRFACLLHSVARPGNEVAALFDDSAGADADVPCVLPCSALRSQVGIVSC